jgi:acyl-CoA thioester hydrolase
VKLDELYGLESRAAVRVRYADTDQMGVAYYANHLVWFEIGRTEFVRLLGFTYRQMEKAGAFLPVVTVTVNYRAPAHYDDLLEVRSRVSKLSHVSISFEYEIVRREPDDGLTIATGSTRHAFIDRSGRLLKNAFEILRIEPIVV